MLLQGNRKVFLALVAIAGASFRSKAFAPTTTKNRHHRSVSLGAQATNGGQSGLSDGQFDRREAFKQGFGLVVGAGALSGASLPSYAGTGASDGNLPDLPNEAVRSYLQYRIPLQTSTDFFLFDLLDTLEDPSEWGVVGELFQSKPTRIEREFTNVMRVVGLSMPPDEAEEMREAQFQFEKAMATLSKITLGIRRDLPVELDPDIVPKAKAAWDDGRQGLNKL